MYGNRPAVIAGCSLKPRSSAQVVLSAFTTAVPLNPPGPSGGDGVFGTAGPKADSSFSKKLNEVKCEVYKTSTCLHECMAAI